MLPYALIKYDTEKEEPIRDVRGLCIEVPRGERKMHHVIHQQTNKRPDCLVIVWIFVLFSPGQTGLLVGKISKISPFLGYVRNKQQTERKKLKDVLVKGDVYFNTGDLLKMDRHGFIYFQDRIGDTFRSVNQKMPFV